MPSSGKKAGVAAGLVTGVLDLLFPPRCAFCGRLLDEPGEVCAVCRESLPFREEADIVQRIGENGYRCAVTFYYDGPVREGIRALKFGKKSWRARVFGRYAARTAAERLGGEFDAVTFVPVSRKRNFERGFDQARLLAEEAARLWGVRAEPVLKKTRHTRAQSSLHDGAARAKNVRGAYAVPHPERVRGRRFLLFDDVCTTGSTMSAAADALLAAGAAGVVCAALAGGRRRAEDGEKSLGKFGKF